MLDQNDNHNRIIADVWGQYDRYKLASPPEYDNDEPEEGDWDWTGDFDPEEHLHEEDED